MKTGYVYLVESGPGGPIKIGFTSLSPHDRVRNLQTGNPHRLQVVVAVPGEMEDESDLHERFASHRISGEWFQRSPEIEAFILGAKMANPDCDREIAPTESPLGITSRELEAIAAEVVSRRECTAAENCLATEPGAIDDVDPSYFDEVCP